MNSTSRPIQVSFSNEIDGSTNPPFHISILNEVVAPWFSFPFSSFKVDQCAHPMFFSIVAAFRRCSAISCGFGRFTFFCDVFPPVHFRFHWGFIFISDRAACNHPRPCGARVSSICKGPVMQMKCVTYKRCVIYWGQAHILI